MIILHPIHYKKNCNEKSLCRSGRERKTAQENRKWGNIIDAIIFTFFGKWENKIIVLYVLYVVLLLPSFYTVCSVGLCMYHTFMDRKERIKGNLKSILMGRFAWLCIPIGIGLFRLVHCMQLRKCYFPKVVHTIEWVFKFKNHVMVYLRVKWIRKIRIALFQAYARI